MYLIKPIYIIDNQITKDLEIQYITKSNGNSINDSNKRLF